MEPIKIGWLGSALDGPGGGYDKIHRLAFDEADEAGLLDRRVEFVLHGEHGLPHGSAKNATDGFRYLVDEGCLAVAGAYSSDNAITVGPLADELHVPLISWCGTDRLQGDYCFRLGNGDCGGDAALVYMGYGMLAAKGLLRRALDELDWDPPRIMSTAFMWYLAGFEYFEGWVGIDQFDPSNPLVQGFHARFVDRYGEDPPMWPNAIPVLAYDTARVLAEGLFRAPILSGPGVKAGLESIRFMPSTTGGPRTHIACSPYEHGMFRGDWLLYGRVRNGALEFEGLFEPA